jgi:hypothetical protein
LAAEGGKEDGDDDGGGDGGGGGGGGGGVVEAGGRGRGRGVEDDWRRVAISISTSVARGVEGGYRVADDWTLRCRSLLLHPDDDGDDDDDGARRQSLPVDGTSDFGEALKSLPAKECYRSRLANALDALDLATKAAAIRDDNGSNDAGQPRVSVRRAAKLVRCCALFLEEDEDNDDDDDNDVYGANDRGLRDRVVSHLARSMPSSSSSRRVVRTSAAFRYPAAPQPLTDC